MKHYAPDRSAPLLLGVIALLLLVLAWLLLADSAGTAASDPVGTGTAIPLAKGSFTHPGDIQRAATGLQNAAPVAPAQLSQLQISR